MTGTQLSFADFAQAQKPAEATREERAKFYCEAFKEREKKNAFSFGLDNVECMFSLLWEHFEGNWSEENGCWEMAREIAGEIIGRGCEPKIKNVKCSNEFCKWEGAENETETVVEHTREGIFERKGCPWCSSKIF